MSHLEKLKQTFREIGVTFILEDKGEGWVNLVLCNKEEQENNVLEERFFKDVVLFEFHNEELVSF